MLNDVESNKRRRAGLTLWQENLPSTSVLGLVPWLNNRSGLSLKCESICDLTLSFDSISFIG